MLTDATRLCALCKQILPLPPAPAVCGGCGAVACLHHSDFDPRVKHFLAALTLSRDCFLSHRSEQSSWEFALEVLLAGAGGGHPSPFGNRLRFESPAVDCYPLAVQLATHWRDVGAPISHTLLDTIGRGAGLIAASHPIRRAS